MTVLDRYLIKMYARTLAISLVSLTGLFVIIDAFGNLDEFLSHSRREGSLFAVLTAYYFARTLTFFEMTSVFLSAISVTLAVAWLHRSNEMIRMMAAGVSTMRIARPLLIAAGVTALLAAANRELLIPQFKDRLSKNAQDWYGEKEMPVNPRHDRYRGVLLNGQSCVAGEQKILKPSFLFHDDLPVIGRRLSAKAAKYLPAEGERPAGYLLTELERPASLDDYPSVVVDGVPALLTPHDYAWLEPGNCFVASEVDFEFLAGGSRWLQYSSTGEILRAISNPSLDLGGEARVTAHWRLVQPLAEFVVLLWMTPTLIRKGSRNPFLAAGKGIGFVATFFLAKLILQNLGQSGMLPPVVAAWAPLLVYAPLAFSAAFDWREATVRVRDYEPAPA